MFLIPLLIFPSITGMTWAEIKSLWREGLTEFLQSGTKMMDFVILALYWITLTLNLISYVMVRLIYSHVRYTNNFLCNTRCILEVASVSGRLLDVIL